MNQVFFEFLLWATKATFDLNSEVFKGLREKPTARWLVRADLTLLKFCWMEHQLRQGLVGRRLLFAVCVVKTRFV
jgi:hypothetical protein